MGVPDAHHSLGEHRDRAALMMGYITQGSALLKIVPGYFTFGECIGSIAQDFLFGGFSE